jgi:hypothetical protein
MGQARAKPNIPDIVIGCVLLVAIPLAALLLIPKVEHVDTEAATGQPAARGLPLTLVEVDEMSKEYSRMYTSNGKLFLLRAQDPGINSEYQAQEREWARVALERCRKGYADLLAGARAAPLTPEMQGRITEIQEALARIDGDLRTLPAGSAGSPPPPAPASR